MPCFKAVGSNSRGKELQKEKKIRGLGCFKAFESKRKGVTEREK